MRLCRPLIERYSNFPLIPVVLMVCQFGVGDVTLIIVASGIIAFPLHLLARHYTPRASGGRPQLGSASGSTRIVPLASPVHALVRRVLRCYATRARVDDEMAERRFDG
jgi:hypothetical protein